MCTLDIFKSLNQSKATKCSDNCVKYFSEKFSSNITHLISKKMNGFVFLFTKFYETKWKNLLLHILTIIKRQ